MKKNSYLLYGCVGALLAMPWVSLAAQSDEDLFGAGTVVATPAPATPADTSTGLLKTDTVKVGGSFFFESGLTETLDSPPIYPV